MTGSYRIDTTPLLLAAVLFTAYFTYLTYNEVTVIRFRTTTDCTDCLTLDEEEDEE